MVLDGLDRRILELLQADARMSWREIARQIPSTVPTVGARVKRMEDSGIITGYTVLLDPAVFGARHHEDVDLAVAANVACHTCGQRTADPVWWSGDGRKHPFCCPMCKAHFVKRHDAASEAL